MQGETELTAMLKTKPTGCLGQVQPDFIHRAMVILKKKDIVDEEVLVANESESVKADYVLAGYNSQNAITDSFSFEYTSLSLCKRSSVLPVPAIPCIVTVY